MSPAMDTIHAQRLAHTVPELLTIRLLIAGPIKAAVKRDRWPVPGWSGWHINTKFNTKQECQELSVLSTSLIIFNYKRIDYMHPERVPK